MPGLFFSITPTAVEWSKVCKGKKKYCCLWSCFEGKKHCSRQHHDPSRVFTLEPLPPPPSSRGSDTVLQTSAVGWSGHVANSLQIPPEGMTEGAHYTVQWETTTKTVLLLTNRRSRFMWRITNTKILLGWENKMFLSLFSASLSFWVGEVCEWVSGWLGSMLCQVTFSNFLSAISSLYH